MHFKFHLFFYLWDILAVIFGMPFVSRLSDFLTLYNSLCSVTVIRLRSEHMLWIRKFLGIGEGTEPGEMSEEASEVVRDLSRYNAIKSNL